ncbi:MAG: hypothetical protein OXM61_01615 [Candidatus Poribacteria bacterium]|nr:hypothetical protein [Candidatus Poribacteria bacterium]
MASTRDTGEMVNGKKHGYWITYFASGLKRSEGNFIHGKKDGKWILYHKNGNISSVAYFRDDKYEGDYICYHENGNRKWGGPYKKHDGTSSDGRKEGVWHCWEEDGETVWRIITYKKGGARAKPDEHPFGECDGCGEGRRSTWGDNCPRCGIELD